MKMVLMTGVRGMPSYEQYLQSRVSQNKTVARAILARNRIMEKPSVIRIDRLAYDQTVRIEANRYILDESSSFTETQNLRIVVFGVKGHPSVIDNDFISDDIFYYDNEKYRIESSWETTGEIQAIAIKMN